MTNCARVLIVSALLLAPPAACESVAQTDGIDRTISYLSGEVYRARVGDQHTVFMVTPAGIALVDPLSLETAHWLEEEFARRFPQGVVRFVIHTSHRFDRAEGASLFVAPAELVGHRRFNSGLSAARQDGPASIPVSDRVRDKDRDGDGRVTAEELYRRVRDVESFFDERRVLVLGGLPVELQHAPAPLAPEHTVVNFPRQRVAFATEAPPLNDAPFTFGTWKAREARRWLAAVASLDFDTLILGDGSSVPKARITTLSSYVAELVQLVAEDYEGGGSVAGFTETKLPQAYRSDEAFRDWRANVNDVYRDLSLFRVDATVGMLGHYAVRDGSYCVEFETCSTGGLVPAAAGSLSVGFGRWAGVAEFSVSSESFTTNVSRFVDEDFALVETRTSYMARYSQPAGRWSLRYLGGLSYTIGDREGIRRIKEGMAPFAGRHPIESQKRRWAYITGLDIVMGRGLGVVVPLRFNFATADDSGTFPHRLDAQVGLTLTMRLFRSID